MRIRTYQVIVQLAVQECQGISEHHRYLAAHCIEHPSWQQDVCKQINTQAVASPKGHASVAGQIVVTRAQPSDPQDATYGTESIGRIGVADVE